MSTILDRINILVGCENLSPTALSKRLGMPQNSVNYYLKGERKLSLEFVEKIIQEFPAISVNWIMRGKGEMRKGPDPESCNLTELSYYKSLAKLRSMHIRELEMTIAKLQVELENLTGESGAEDPEETNSQEETKPLYFPEHRATIG